MIWLGYVAYRARRGDAVGFALAALTAAHIFLWAAAMRFRAAALNDLRLPAGRAGATVVENCGSDVRGRPGPRLPSMDRTASMCRSICCR